MQPMKVTGGPHNAAGAVRLTYGEAGETDVLVWNPATAGGQQIGLPHTMPATDFADAAAKRFLLEGFSAGEQAQVRLGYTYRGKEIFVDEALLEVRDLPGLAGEQLTGFPHFNYVHTFNQGTSVRAALDPFDWAHLTNNKVLPTSQGDKPDSRIWVVPHQSPAQWAADRVLAGTQSVDHRLEGRRLADNIRTSPPMPTAGDFDVVIDIADADGEPGLNGQFDPGDIIGKFTVDASDAEVHVVRDPLTTTVNPETGHAAYAHVGHMDYGSAPGVAGDTFTIPALADGNPAAVADNYIHGRIYYPVAAATGHNVAAAAGVFPLVVLLHGNHLPRRFMDGLGGPAGGGPNPAQADAITNPESYLGFIYLQQRLAQMGYVSVSVDLDRYVGTNPLTAPDFAWAPPGILARAWCAAMNIDRVRTLGAAGGTSRIAGHVDFSDVTLIDHSRGGEAVIELANYRDTTTGPFAGVGAGGAGIATFPITRVISIAPTANRTTSVGNRPYLALHGSADGDVFTAAGFLHYDTAPALKSMLFVHGADHNQFNSAWPYSEATHEIDGRWDVVPLAGGPVGGNLRTRDEQEDLLVSYTLAWIWDGPYREYFSRPASRIRLASLGTYEIQNQFRRPSGAVVLDNFEVNHAFDLSSSGGAVAGQGLTIGVDRSLGRPIPPAPDDHYYQTTRGAELAWDRTDDVDYYRQATMAATRDASESGFLSFRVGSHFQQTMPQSFTVELADDAGRVAYVDTAHLAALPVPYAATNLLGEDVTKMAFQTLRINLDAIQADGRTLNLGRVVSARLIFDRTDNGRVALDDIEFTD